MTMQDDWRSCSRCKGLVHALGALAACPAGVEHSLTESGRYSLTADDPRAPGQHGWRRCGKCQGLCFAGQGVCPAGGSHDGSGSRNYALLHAPDRDPEGDAQQGWRWCSKCQGLYFDAERGRCPAGEAHDGTTSGHYALARGAAHGAGRSSPPRRAPREPAAVEALLSEIQRVPAERRAGVDLLLDRLAEEVDDAQRDRLPAAEDTLGGGIPKEIGFRIGLGLSPARASTIEAVLDGKGALAPLPIGIAPKALGADFIDLVRRLEPAVLDLLRASPENAARFASDPIETLRPLLAEHEPRLLHVLEKARAQAADRPVRAPGARVDSVTVAVIENEEEVV